MRLALVGTRGVPARYGGFETCVEEVGARLAARGHVVTVYCRTTSSPTQPRADTYRGMHLVHLPSLPKRSLETLVHTSASVAHLVGQGADVAVVFNAANAPLLPALRAQGIPVATHVDGLEWKRGKWGPVGKRYYRMAEALAVRWSDALIADATGIADYYTDEFGAETTLIAYGAPIVADRRSAPVQAIGLSTRGYHLVVARMEPENHVDVIVDGYRRSGGRLPLVVVGSAPYAEFYTARVHSLADDRVRFLGGVWDQELLDQLYANALTYLHGHSVGGTNPSLLRAIGAGAATSAFDVVFNREVLGPVGRYFTDAEGVRRLVEQAEADPHGTVARGFSGQQRAVMYDWDDVADSYEQLCERLAAGNFYAARPSGRRGSPVRQPEVVR